MLVVLVCGIISLYLGLTMLGYSLGVVSGRAEESLKTKWVPVRKADLEDTEVDPPTLRDTGEVDPPSLR